ncbi:S28 family serine protease [Nocardiopsis mangrovi]|uniref:S28 family serine protease n=1 Tax=Nocardiopsis mangrovi TaxID=1179818 RepID=A0ABV9E0H1_9ACTN
MIPPPHPGARWRTAAAALLTASALVLTAAPAGAAPAPAGGDIADRLAAVPGLRIISEQETEPGFRHFVLGYRQPADHDRPRSGGFEQRLTLLHRGFDRPTVLHTSGYGVNTTPFRAEPTRLVDGNQISTEQRFFSPSRPDPADWDDLDIEQAAADHHRVIAALDGIYREAWISTGASKGGMTSVYHRRFYPDDLDGTVAYVAPNDADDREDSAYVEFFDTVGDDPQCREDLRTLQREALLRRDGLVGRYEELAAGNGWTFDETIGSADRTFEMLVLDTPWAFWQYQEPEKCADVPGAEASDDEIAAFLDEIAGFEFYTDQGTGPYIPYYFQAATQLGSPSVPTAHLDGLLRYPGLFAARSYLPDDLAGAPFDRRAMPDIDRWVAHRAERILFVDGEWDPWGAEPFRVGNGARREALRFVAPQANHGAAIAGLGASDRAAATDALLRWAGIEGRIAARGADRIPALDDVGDGRGRR